MSILRQVEKKIEQRLQKWLGPEASSVEGREVIEVHRAVLEDVVQHISTLQRGRKTFPYNRLDLQVAVPDAGRRPVFQLALSEGEQLTIDVKDALRQAGCEPPEDLTIATEILAEPTPETSAHGFYIAYRQVQPLPVSAPKPEAAGAAKLVVLVGEPLTETVPLVKNRTNLGRLADLVDDQQRLVRRNDVAFSEADGGPNATVSRAHGYIQRDAVTGEYRLHDEGSSYGTAVLRDGRLIPVPGRTGRGIILRNGDEIYLGQARLRFEQ